MKKKLITEIDRLKELMGLTLLTESVDYEDISSLSKLKSGPIKNPKYFILHHSAGRGSAQSVVNTLNTRVDKKTGKRMILGVQWVIDREGRIFRTLPIGARGTHILNADLPSVPSDITNSTAEGVEIVGNNDSDILEIQCLSALKIIKGSGYSIEQVYGHGEVNSHKARNEGQFCKPFIKKYWNEDFEKLEKEITGGTLKYDKGVKKELVNKKFKGSETNKKEITNKDDKKNSNDSKDSNKKEDEKNLDPMQKLLKKAQDFKEKGVEIDFTKGLKDAIEKLKL
jgi:hypothetical protein